MLSKEPGEGIQCGWPVEIQALETHVQSSSYREPKLSLVLLCLCLLSPTYLRDSCPFGRGNGWPVWKNPQLETMVSAVADWLTHVRLAEQGTLLLLF